MSMPVIIQGTLQPDGSLKLDQMPNLPPGPVMVANQPINKHPKIFTAKVPHGKAPPNQRAIIPLVPYRAIPPSALPMPIQT